MSTPNIINNSNINQYSPFNTYFGLADIITQKRQENILHKSINSKSTSVTDKSLTPVTTAFAVTTPLNPKAIPFIPTPITAAASVTITAANDTNKNDVHYKLTLQRQRAAMNHQQYSKVRFCVFCQKTGKPLSMQKSHRLRDGTGCVECPYLRRTVCQQCGATGDDAHYQILSY